MQFFLVLGVWVVVALVLSPRIGSLLSGALGADQAGYLPRAHRTFRHFRRSRNEMMPAALSKSGAPGKSRSRRNRDAKGHTVKAHAILPP
jgi:hypothetical protein